MSIIPLRFRQVKPLSINIRSSELTYSEYYLQYCSNKETGISKKTGMTMIPKFELDLNNKQISHSLLDNDEMELTGSGLDSNKNKLLDFNINLSEFTFLEKKLEDANIMIYPIIIFEFSNGYYTTKEGFMKNSQLIAMTMPGNVSIDRQLTQESYLNTEVFNNTEINEIINSEDSIEDNIKKTKSTKSMIVSSSHKSGKLPALDIAKGNSNKITTEKYSEYFENIHRMAWFNSILTENQFTHRDEFFRFFDVIKENNEGYLRKIRIQKMKDKIQLLKDKKIAIEQTIQNIKEGKSEKEQRLSNNTSGLKTIESSYEDKERDTQRISKKYGNLQVILNAVVKKKIVEMSYLFFNKEIKQLYFIPTFYNDNFKESNISSRSELYSMNIKFFASMIGHVALFVNYLSQTGNICLKYPGYINGSKSYGIKNREFKNGYSDPKIENRHYQFEQSLRFLKDNLMEIIKYGTQYEDIVIRSDYEDINSVIEEKSLFYLIVMFNKIVFKFVTNCVKHTEFYKQ